MFDIPLCLSCAFPSSTKRIFEQNNGQMLTIFRAGTLGAGAEFGFSKQDLKSLIYREITVFLSA